MFDSKQTSFVYEFRKMDSLLHSLMILIMIDVVVFVDCSPSPACDSSPCLNGGSCTNDQYVAGFICFCPSGYTGQRCELAPWPIWSDTPVVIVKRGEAAKLDCQYQQIPTSNVYTVTWQYYTSPDINLIRWKPMWTYSKSGEYISSDYNERILSNDTRNIYSMHSLYYLNVTENISVRCEVNISNKNISGIVISMEVKNTPGVDILPVTSTTPSIDVEVGTSVDFRCNFNKVEDLSGMGVTWYYGNVTFSTEKILWRALFGNEGNADQKNCGSLCEFVDTGAPLSNSHSIRIKDISLQREGYYMCVITAANGKKQGNATTHLTALVPPTPEVSLSPDDPYAGDKVRITCTAPAVKPATNVSMWVDVAEVKYTDTVNIEIEDKTSRVTLSTDVLVGEQHHGQSVVCGAMWKNMIYESDIQTLLYVKYPPESVTISANSAFPIKEYSLVTVTCTAVGGNPLPNLEIINKRNSIHQVLGYSPLSLTVNRTLHGSELQCNASGGGIKSGFLLSNVISISVYYSASTVKIDGVTTDLQETDTLELTCSAEGGNPDDYTYSWNFIPKYGGADSNTFGDTVQLAVPNLNYANAGHYRCQASNIGGATSIVKVVTIKFSPRVLEDGFKRLVHTDINQEVDLIVPFLSYPPPTSVTWLSPSMAEINGSWASDGKDRLHTVLKVNTANDKNFGWYNCTIRNSEGVLLAAIELRKGRRPYPPKDARAFNMTAFSMLLKWTAGANGGSSQTFKVIYRANGVDKVYKESISDPGEGRRVTLQITGLTPKTTYGLWIIGENAIDDSDPLILSVQTRGLPLTPEIRITQTGNEAEISWETPGDYDMAVLVQCRVDADMDSSTCTNLNVSGEASRHVVEADPAVTYTYRLELYQYDVKVASTEDVRKEPYENSARTISAENNVAVVAGGSVGVCVLVIVIIAVVLGVIWHRRKSNQPETVYQNSDAAATVYESNISSDTNQPVSPYTTFSVTATTTSDGCSDGVYEDVHVLDSVPASCLRLPGAVLHRGLYTTTVLTTVTGASHITNASQVIAKVVNKKCVPGKMALTQEVEALRKVKFYKNLAVYIGYNITSQEPAFLLSERASQGDLLSYLQTAQRAGLNLPQADLMHFVGGIVSGLRHLHGQNPPLVMHCLNCSHVLLADNLTCQLTGFGYSRDVSLRHQYADSVKYTKCDRWLAPEVLSSCEHSEASDVWSLGATLWEIFTLGNKPYCKYSDAAVKSHVLTGEIVLKTETIPTDIFTIIQQCMILNPDSRISLDQIEGNIIEKSEN